MSTFTGVTLAHGVTPSVPTARSIGAGQRLLERTPRV
jgi:hypothetical protein